MSSKFLEYSGHNFLFQHMEEVTRCSHFRIESDQQGELAVNLKAECNLGENDHEMIVFMILRKGRCESSRRTMDFKKAHFNQLRELVGEVPRENI